MASFTSEKPTRLVYELLLNKNNGYNNIDFASKRLREMCFHMLCSKQMVCGFKGRYRGCETKALSRKVLEAINHRYIESIKHLLNSDTMMIFRHISLNI